MKEKDATKISLSTFFLILSIIAIVVMGIFIYKLNNDKTAEIQKSTELQAQVNSLNRTVSDLQGKINSISETVNSTNNVNNSANNTNSQANTNTTPKLGIYTVDQIKQDGAGISNEGCGVKLKQNNEFEIYVGYGCWYSGKYELRNSELVCSATKYETESGGYFSKKTDVIVKFKVISSNKLELSKITVNDSETNERSFEDVFTKGMTYSIK